MRAFNGTHVYWSREPLYRGAGMLGAATYDSRDREQANTPAA